jgi:hypothetical protein
MKGIYLTEEAKQEIEAKIVELEAKAEYYKSIDSSHRRSGALARIFILQEILESATILPVEKSWKLSVVSITPYKQGLLKSLYKNGVIIQPKQ